MADEPATDVQTTTQDRQILDDLTNLQNGAPTLESEVQSPVENPLTADDQPDSPSQQDSAVSTTNPEGATSTEGQVPLEDGTVSGSEPSPSGQSALDLTGTTGTTEDGGTAPATSTGDPATDLAGSPDATTTATDASPTATSPEVAPATSTDATGPIAATEATATETPSDPASGTTSSANAETTATTSTSATGTADEPIIPPTTGTDTGTDTGTGTDTPPSGGTAEPGVGSSSGTFTALPGLSISKAVDQVLDAAGNLRSTVGAVGDGVTFSVTVTNTGNTVLGNVSITDPLAPGNLVASGVTLQPGETATFTFTYTVTENDIVTSGGGDNLLNSTASATSDQTAAITADAGVEIAGNPPVFLDPVSQAPASAYAFTYTENSDPGTVIGTVGATDPDGDSVTYAITGGNEDGFYAIDPKTGAISLTEAGAASYANDYEQRDRLPELQVTANDGTSTSVIPVNLALANLVDYTATITLNAITASEGQDLVFTATLDQPVTGSDLVITLDNGAVITIPVGATTGSSDSVANPNGEDVYTDSGNFTVDVASTSGGSFEALGSSPATVTIEDTVDTVTVSLAAKAASVDEATAPGFTVSLSQALADDLVVTLDNGETVTIKAGDTSADYSLPAQGDDLYADGGSATLALASAAVDGKTFEDLVVATTPVSVTIDDTVDTVTVSLAAKATSVDEATAPGFTVSLSQALADDLVVTLDNGETVTIKAGDTSADYTLPAQGDDLYADGGSATLALASAAVEGKTFEDLVVATTPVSVTIDDTVDTVTVSLAAKAASVDEATAPGFTVSLSQVLADDLVVTLDNGETVPIAAGTTSADYSLPAQGDDLYADGGSATLALASAAVEGKTFEDLVVETTPVSVTIEDTVDTVTVSLAAKAASVDEATAPGFTVSLSQALADDLVVTLDNGETVTIKAGDTSADYSLPAQGDDLYADGGSATLALSSASVTGKTYENLVVATTPVSVTINDTVDTVTVSLAAAPTVAGTGLTYTATLSHVAQNDLRVTLTSGDSFIIAKGSLSGTSSAISTSGATSLNSNAIQSLVELDAQGRTLAAGSAGTFEQLSKTPGTLDFDKLSDSQIVLTTSDAKTVGAASDSTSASFAPAFALTQTAGIIASVAYQLAVAAAGSKSGLTIGGKDIYLFNDGSNVVGTTSSAGTISDGTKVFALSVSANGVVTLTQFQQLDHTSATTSAHSADTVTLGDNLVKLSATATEGTASQTQTIDLGGNVRFADDGPTLGTIQNQQIGNNPTTSAITATGALAFAPGADDYGSVTKLSAVALADITYNNAIVTSASGNVLTGYVETDIVAGLSAGDTQIFTLTLNPATGTKGEYTFSLLKPIDNSLQNYTVGSASSFGAGPTSSQVLSSSAGTQLAAVAGFKTDGTFNATTWAGTLSSVTATNSGMASDSVNGSTRGWGVSNQNLDQGEMLRFDFGRTTDFDGGGAYAPPTVTLPGTTAATLTFDNFTSSDVVKVKVVYTDGTAQLFNVTSTDLTASSASKTFTATGGHLIDWIDVYGATISSGGGKVGLGAVDSFTSTIDKTLTFSTTLSDKDGDTATGSFSITVKTGATPFTTTTPIAFDLDGNGVQYLGLDRGVHYDYTGTGRLVSTAWVAAGDGLLAHLLPDGAVSITFSTAAGQTDLEGLAQQFDANHDGVFSLADSAYAAFGIWQDANSNGLFETGEFTTLSDAGIVGINLTSDGQPQMLLNGQVQVYGSTSFLRADGSSGVVQDVGFVTHADSPATSTDSGAQTFNDAPETHEAAAFSFDEEMDLSAFTRSEPLVVDPVDIVWGHNLPGDQGGWDDGAIAVARADSPLAVAGEGGWTICVDHGHGFDPVVPTPEQLEAHQIQLGEASTVRIDMVSAAGIHEEYLMEGVSKVSWGG